jgi:hypothetical protein
MPLRMGVGVATPLPDVEVLLAVTRVEGGLRSGCGGLGTRWSGSSGRFLRCWRGLLYGLDAKAFAGHKASAVRSDRRVLEQQSVHVDRRRCFVCTHPAAKSIQLDPIVIEDFLAGHGAIVVDPPRAVRRGCRIEGQPRCFPTARLDTRGRCQRSCTEPKHR